MTTSKARDYISPTALLKKARSVFPQLLQLPRRLKISHLLFFSHLLLVLWLILVMSYKRYQNDWQTRVDHAVEVARLSMNPIIEDLSLSASGLNYANIHLPTTLNRFHSANKLLYFHVDAVSDFSRTPFRFAYSRQKNEVWQTGLGSQDEQNAIGAIQRLQKAQLENPNTDKVKYAFLLNRAQERYISIVNDRQKTEHYRSLFQEPSLTLGQYQVNEKQKILHILLPLHNTSGGKVWAVFDAAELLELQSKTIHQIIREALIAFLVSAIMIVWATWWIVQPLRRLSNYMNHEIHDLDVTALPELNRDDEIGMLARCFRNLIRRIRNQIADLERLAIIDALTGLGSRRLYDTSGKAFLKQARRTNLCFAMLVIDADYFKRYNDTYGHAQGDEGLRMIGRVLQSTLQRETDLAFRLGGEEFVVLLQVTKAQEVQVIAEQIRQAVLAERMVHEKNDAVGFISVSIGGVVLVSPKTRPYVSLNQLFVHGDKMLYAAKAAGRNRVMVSEYPASVESGDKKHLPQHR